MRPTFFKTAIEFGRWLHQHHASETEILVGFRRKGSGLGGLTYAGAVDEALCVGCNI